MKKLKVVTIVGTRPEIIRLSVLIPRLDQLTDHILVHTGQNNDRNLNEVFFEDLDLREPDYYLNVDTSSMGNVMGDTLKKSEEVLIKECPDAVMILGDTNSAIAAVVAERLGIPVYHMEAGNRSFDANVPEELNRKMVDHISSFNLPYNDYSLRNLLAEGIHPRRISKSGSPIKEIFHKHRAKIEASDALEREGLEKGHFILCSIHRQENVDLPSRLATVMESLSSVQETYNLPLLISTHPRTQQRITSLQIERPPNLIFHEPFGYLDYCKLQMNAFVVISDSGTISEESAIMGFPAVSIRESIERPESLETGSTILAGITKDSVLDAVSAAIALPSATLPDGYEIADFSIRVTKFLLSTVRLSHKWSGIHKA
jgi:UDP-N-acetylglucosamine 2-epimerase